MPRQLTSADLRRLADDLDNEETQEAQEATAAQLRELLDQPRLTAEEVERFREIIAERAEDPPAEDPPAEDPPAEDPPAEDPPVEDDPPLAEVKTRPGRRSGQAYNFTVDEQGHVVRDGMAQIYTGDDEPDQVELPPEREAETDEPEEVEAA